MDCATCENPVGKIIDMERRLRITLANPLYCCSKCCSQIIRDRTASANQRELNDAEYCSDLFENVEPHESETHETVKVVVTDVGMMINRNGRMVKARKCEDCGEAFELRNPKQVRCSSCQYRFRMKRVRSASRKRKDRMRSEGVAGDEQ